MPIPLMRHTFLDEEDAKTTLCSFIQQASKLSMGEEVLTFEKEFARWQGRTFCTMVNSGSSANLVLLQSLLNLGRLQKGDKIGVSAVTWATNVMPILQLGCTPVLIDVDSKTLNVSAETLQNAPEIRCLFLTHLLGFSSDVSLIQSYCNEKSIILLEDTCESLGARNNGVHLGNFGLAATFSTFVGHHMSTIEGGMIVTNDSELNTMIRMVRAHGWDRNVTTEVQSSLREKWNVTDFFAPYTFYTLGYNVRPMELQGVLGQHQLKRINSANSIRRANYRYIRDSLDSSKDVYLPDQDTPAFAIPVVCRTPEIRDRCIEKCQTLGIEIRPLVAGNMARQPFFKDLHDGRILPNADLLHHCAFYMPNHPDLTETERNDLCNALTI
jgi:CDP-6-deoxy-D-xylo-4-hexulose-3-dehydrase